MHDNNLPAPERPLPPPDNNLPEAPSYDLRLHQARVEARTAANIDPLPGPLLNAFVPERVVVAGLTIHRIRFGHVALLRRIDSPLIANHGGQAAPMNEEQLMEAICLLTRTPSEGFALLARGRREFNEIAFGLVGDALLLCDVQAVSEAPVAQITAGSAPALAHRAAATEGGDGNFRTPQAEPTTASAGESTSSRSSAATTAGASIS